MSTFFTLCEHVFLHYYYQKIRNAFSTKVVAAPLATMDTSFLVIEPHIMPDYFCKKKKAFNLILLSSYHSQKKRKKNRPYKKSK